MHLSDKEFKDLMDLLRRLADKIESFTPNVKGASDENLLDVQFLVKEARRTAFRLEEAPNLTEYSYTRSEMIDAAIAHARLLGTESNYFRNLGILVDFVDVKFPSH